MFTSWRKQNSCSLATQARNRSNGLNGTRRRAAERFEPADVEHRIGLKGQGSREEKFCQGRRKTSRSGVRNEYYCNAAIDRFYCSVRLCESGGKAHAGRRSRSRRRQPHQGRRNAQRLAAFLGNAADYYRPTCAYRDGRPGISAQPPMKRSIEGPRKRTITS